MKLAKEWITKENVNIPLYVLKNKYKQKFGVDKITAYKDLTCLNVPGAKEKVIQLEIHNKNKSLKSKEKNKPLIDNDSNEEFYYIAGYTSGGIPYGITHEQMGNIKEETDESFDDLPF